MESVDKRAKAKAIASITRYSRRLVEYFIVVSSVPKFSTDNSNTGSDVASSRSQNLSYSSEFDDTPQNISIEDDIDDELNFDPVITSRYPLKDHPGSPLHQSVTTFCHPDGVIKLKSKPSLPKIHYFVMSGKRGSNTYGVCLTVYEPYKIVLRSGPSPTEVEMYIPKCICILSAYPYLVAFREYLTQLDRLTKRGDMKIPLERYITNFCAEIPAPPPGSFEVQATILDSVISMWTPPYNQPIAWVSLPFSHLFECLDIDNIITVWHALALEKQVLIVSSQLTLLTTACEILTSFLFPMRWSHAYIPLLPRFLMPILAAPTSFLIGIDRRYFNEALQHLSNDCIVVDLDKNLVNLGTQIDNIPRIPQWFENELKEVLKQNAGMIYREARSLRKEDDYSDRGQFLQLHVKEMSDAMWESKLSIYDGAFHLAFTPEMIKNPDFLNGNDNSGMGEITDVSSTNSSSQHFKKMSRTQSKWDSVQEAFFLVYVDLLQNYRKSLVFPSKEVSSSSSEPDGNNTAFGDFKSKDFLKSQRHEKRRFLAELVKTQMFDDFITKRLYGSGASDVTFFDQAIDNYVKHSISSVMDPITSMSPISSPPRENRTSSAVPDIATVKRLIGRVRSRNYFCLSDSGEPLIQSAKIRRSLKTVVAPEPNCESLADDSESIYKYEIFPSKLDETLFCEPRPLPPVVVAEFDRQKEDAALFRKKIKMLEKKVRKSAQDATFTVFFVAYSAMIGRELIELYHDALMSDSIPAQSIPAVLTSSTSDSDSQHTAADSDSEFGDEFEVNEVHRRAKFIESISSAKVEEAKAIGRAQLNLAFEILDIMKERQCNTEPAAYKYLIDACGRCGDTDRATQVLKRMHQDGIVADGVVYSRLVSAFSVENSFGRRPHEENVPDWTNGAPTNIDWNILGSSKAKINFFKSEEKYDAEGTLANNIRKNVLGLIERYKTGKDDKMDAVMKSVNEVTIRDKEHSKENYVTENVAQQIGFGENLLEVVYPDISIDTDDEKCPNCGTFLLDDDVVKGWIADANSYTTNCPICKKGFVPKFRVQSTSPSFVGSKGPGTPLICERLSPWVLEKELKTKMSDIGGTEDLLDPVWREKETKNAVLWWNLILSFMRYRLPFTFLLQGSFPQDLISPKPSTDEDI